MINLSVQQVLSLWAHGTVLRNLTGNGAGREGGGAWVGGEGVGRALAHAWASCQLRGLERGEWSGFACALRCVGGRVVLPLWEPGEAAP